MIAANELRVGNKVEGIFKDGVKQIVTVLEVKQDALLVEIIKNSLPHAYAKYHEVEPIQLTPEILEKCGFEWFKTDQINDFENENIYRLRINESNWDVCYVTEDYGGQNHKHIRIKLNYDTLYVKECKTLHQLQNLYFIYNSTELEINL